MKLLLDTHALLWTINQDKRLPSVLIDLIEDPGNDVFVSMASIWEASIKIGLDRAANNPEVRELSQHTSIEEVAQTIEETLPPPNELLPAHRYRWVPHPSQLYRDGWDVNRSPASSYRVTFLIGRSS